MAVGISPALPLTVDEIDGPYRLTKTIAAAMQQNFKHLILTNPGERIMDPEFGVGIRRYLFELAESDVRDMIKNRIRKQVSKYLPMIRVYDISFGEGSSDPADAMTIEEGNTLYVKIRYSIPTIKVGNVLEIPLQ
jgi:phage baseplate assembly protein W